MDKEESFSTLLAFHAGATLRGIKAGNLLRIGKACFARMQDEYARIRQALERRGVYMHVLRKSEKSVLLYVYRPRLLDAHLSQAAARKILSSLGYTQENRLERLAQRLSEDAFPHEIGLFLHYPPEDVIGFMTHRGANCKYCGYWKVYGDVAQAKEQFAAYARCREYCMDCIKRGVPLEGIAA